MESGQQLNIFDETLYKNDLTSRQWRLHNLLMSTPKKLSHKQILERMDSWYGYTDEVRDNPKRVFNDLSARRELSDDLDAIARDMTIQTVLCGTKYAPSEEEAEKWIRRKMMSLGNEWHKLHLQVKKLKPNNQLRLQFNTEKPIWESTTEKVSL